MHFTLRETTDPGKWSRELAMLLTIGAILGWLGPYGTYFCFGLPDRFAYWILRSLLVGLTCVMAFQLVAATGPAASWSPMKRAVVALIIASVPCALVGVALANVFHHPPTSPVEVVSLYGRVAIVTGVVGIPLHLVRTRTARGSAVPSLERPGQMPVVTMPGGSSAFLRRIPARLGTNLLYIEMEDHYLRIHTERGSSLLLFRLSDAVAELGPVIGLQVHRSYWVARQAVASVERDGYRVRLVLTTGVRIPVSRTYLPALREAGWLR
jgi:hypothetical protein